jgi:CBS domain-containing protein
VNVQDVMTRSVQCCSPGDSLSHAARILWENDCGCLPVQDESGRVVAMLTDRDICMAAWTQGRTLHELPVSSAMSREVHKLAPGDPLPRAQRLMQEQQVRRLPVVDVDGRLVGLISLNDLVIEAARDPARRSRGPSTELEGVAITLAAVGQPRNQRPERRQETKSAAKPTALERPLAGAT